MCNLKIILSIVLLCGVIAILPTGAQVPEKLNSHIPATIRMDVGDSFMLNTWSGKVYQRIIGIEAPSYEIFKTETQKDPSEIGRFPFLSISLRTPVADYTYVIPTIFDIPTQSIRTPCPRGVSQISECWFIHYKNEE